MDLLNPALGTAEDNAMGDVADRLPQPTDLDDLPDICLVTDGIGTIVQANRACAEQLGYPIADWLGRNVLDVLHPDDLEPAIAAFSSMEERIEEGSGLLMPVRIRHADGSWLPCEVRGRSTGDDRITLLVRDVSDRHALGLARGDGDLLRALVHHASSILLTLEPDHSVRSTNAALTRILGRDGFRTQGVAFASLAEPSDRNFVAARLEEGEGRFEADFSHVDGSRVVLEVTIQDLRTDPLVADTDEEHLGHALADDDAARLGECPGERQALRLEGRDLAVEGVDLRLDEEGQAGGLTRPALLDGVDG